VECSAGDMGGGRAHFLCEWHWIEEVVGHLCCANGTGEGRWSGTFVLRMALVRKKQLVKLASTLRTEQTVAGPKMSYLSFKKESLIEISRIIL
jgi:hypothetical protein